ncbi:MAG: 30S ribosomal protein S6 [Chloroflexota bacterium]
MSEYELLYIISPRVPADDVQNAVERVSALITAQGGEVLSVDNWGRRRLAYPIRQYFEGTYVLTTMELPPAGAVGLEKALNLAEEVIRHLLISGIIPRNGGRPRDERDQYSDAPTMAPAMDTDAAAPTASEAEAEPEVAESAAAEPAAVEPVAAEPTVAEPATAEPATAEPATAE